MLIHIKGFRKSEIEGRDELLLEVDQEGLNKIMELSYSGVLPLKELEVERERKRNEIAAEQSRLKQKAKDILKEFKELR